MAANEEANERQARILRAESAGPYGTYVIGPIRGDVRGLRRALTHLRFVDAMGAWTGKRRGMLILVGPFAAKGSDGEEVLGYIRGLAEAARKATESGVNAELIMVVRPEERHLADACWATSKVWGWMITAAGFSADACRRALAMTPYPSGGGGSWGGPRPWTRIATSFETSLSLVDGNPPLQAPASEIAQAQICAPGGIGGAGVRVDEHQRVVRLESGLGLGGKLCCLQIQDSHVFEVVVVDSESNPEGEGLMGHLNSEQYEERGRGLLEEKRPAEALQVFQEGLIRFPGDPDLGVGRGFALLDLRRSESARGQFKEVLAARPKFGDAGQGLVDACLALGLKDEAVAAGRAAVPLEERNADFIHCLGIIFFRHKRYEEADWFYRQALERAPEHPHALLGLASSLHLRKRGNEAIELLKAAIPERLKAFWEGYSYLGCLLFDVGRAEEALEILRRIPLDELRDPEAISRLRSFLKSGKYPQRSRVLKFLEERAREARGVSIKKRGPRKLVDDAPLWPNAGFWQSHPTIVGAPEALELDALFGRIFAKPCRFDGVDFPKFKIDPTRQDCEQAITLLREFLEAYPWIGEGCAGFDQPWRAAGAGSLLFYVVAILRQAKAILKASGIDKGKVRSLMFAMVAVVDTAPLGGTIHGAYYYLWQELDRYD